MKFTKVNGKEVGPSGTAEACVIYTLFADDGSEIAQRVQWPSITEGSDREKQMRPHFWGDRGWKFAAVHKEGGALSLFGFAKTQEHLNVLRERAKKQEAVDFTVVPLS